MLRIKQTRDFEQAEKEILDISILSEKEEKYKQLNFMISLYHDRIIDSCRAGFNLITKNQNQYIRNEIEYDRAYRRIGKITFDIDYAVANADYRKFQVHMIGDVDNQLQIEEDNSEKPEEYWKEKALREMIEIPDSPLAQALFKLSDGGKQRMDIIEQYENWILTNDDALNLMHQVKVNITTPLRIDCEEEEMDIEYDYSDSEADELPTHETEAIEDDVMEISTRKIKTDHKLKLKLNKMIMR